MEDRCREIERSIIKRFRKEIWRPFVRALNEYDMIAEGDSIAVVAGIWKDTIGIVQKLDYGKQTATINVELFGRETPVEISFAEVRKL